MESKVWWYVMTKKITSKQRKFANEFIKTNNAFQSAIKAGYSQLYAKNASIKLLENDGVQTYINKKVGKVEQAESDGADEVLKNIYRISAGKVIKRHYVQIDNLQKEAAVDDDSLGARSSYIEDTTTFVPAPIKEQVAAAELWFKLHGDLKNDSDEIEQQKVRKLKAEADIAEARAAVAKDDHNDQMDALDSLLNTIGRESETNG